MAFDLRPTEDVLLWPGNANMAFDLRPTKDVLLWSGNANMEFDLRPTEDVLPWPVIAYIVSKVVPPEKNDEALQLLKLIWNAIAEKPKNEIDKILRDSYWENTPFSDTIYDKHRSIFHIAIKRRHEGIYNLLCEIGSMKDLITPIKDVHGNTMLHLVGKSASRKRRHQPEHKELVKQGERWMKETASQCMVVATLIATIVFAAAFTVPGGYGQNSGHPIFQSKATLIVFVVADAISLFSSTTSILIFLSILTSRYAERDFLVSLPKKLMAGLATLFLSITTMTVAFSVSFFVLYNKGMIWMPSLIGAFAVMPVLLYIRLQYALFFDVIRSTYGSTSYLSSGLNIEIKFSTSNGSNGTWVMLAVKAESLKSGWLLFEGGGRRRLMVKVGFNFSLFTKLRFNFSKKGIVFEPEWKMIGSAAAEVAITCFGHHHLRLEEALLAMKDVKLIMIVTDGNSSNWHSDFQAHLIASLR
ncbi:ankyrin repeat-containing domain, PGG domain protein [Tanacetum coccineum]